MQSLRHYPKNQLTGSLWKLFAQTLYEVSTIYFILSFIIFYYKCSKTFVVYMEPNVTIKRSKYKNCCRFHPKQQMELIIHPHTFCQMYVPVMNINTRIIRTHGGSWTAGVLGLALWFLYVWHRGQFTHGYGPQKTHQKVSLIYWLLCCINILFDG